MKHLIAVPVLLMLALGAIAQKKYERIVYTPVTKETSQATIMARDVVANDAVTKFQLKISNKSEQILLYKPEESVLRINGNEVKPQEKWLMVFPGESDHRIMNFKGPNYLVYGYVFQLNGLYSISETEKAVEAPDFQLPPALNEFKTGNFSCTMQNLSKESDKTSVKFECRYTGSQVGVINPGRAAIRLPDGTEIANAKSKSKSEVLQPGESTKISLSWNRMEGGKTNDMQLVKMQIVWRNTFVEAEPLKLQPVDLEMKIDEALSK